MDKAIQVISNEKDESYTVKVNKTKLQFNTLNSRGNDWVCTRSKTKIYFYLEDLKLLSVNGAPGVLHQGGAEQREKGVHFYFGNETYNWIQSWAGVT